MLKAKIYDRVTIKGSDYDVTVCVHFEARLIPEEIENNIHEDIEVIEVYDDYEVSLDNVYIDSSLSGGENLLTLVGLEIKDLLEGHISEYYSKYKKQITDYI